MLSFNYFCDFLMYFNKFLVSSYFLIHSLHAQNKSTNLSNVEANSTRNVTNSSVNQSFVTLIPNTSSSTADRFQTTTGASASTPSLSISSQQTHHVTTEGFDICTCDFTAQVCDVNCCCDNDCSDDDRKLFTKCGDRSLTQEPRHCMQPSLLVFNNTEYRTTQTREGLLCIAYDNFQSRLFYQEPTLVTTEAEFHEYKQRRYGDDQSEHSYHYALQPATEETYGETYKVGDHLLATTEDNTITSFPLPQAIFTDLCSYSTPAEFFQDKFSSCVLRIANLSAQCKTDSVLSASWYYKRLRLLKTPKARQQTGKEEMNTPMVPIQSSISAGTESVQASFSEHQQFSGNTIPLPLFVPENQECAYAVFEAHYTIVVNQSLGGIVSASVRLRLRNITSAQTIVLQTFSVAFTWWYRTNLHQPQSSGVFRRSGNPGYIEGQPILAGQIMRQNETVAVALEKDRNNWLTILQEDSSGLCRNTVDRAPVLFGYNTISGCFIELNNYRRGADSASEQCRTVQRQIFTALIGPPRDVVAAYGNASINDIRNWIPIILENNTGSAFEVSSSGPTGCSRLTLGLDIEILHAKTGSIEHPQEKILGVKYKYKQAQDVVMLACLSGPCTVQENRTMERLLVMTTVTFTDLTEPAEASVAKIPIIDAKLPNDFFYPFTGISGKSSINRAHAPLLVLITTFALK